MTNHFRKLIYVGVLWVSLPIAVGHAAQNTSGNGVPSNATAQLAASSSPQINLERSGKSVAEVRAEVRVWQRAGLRDFNRGAQTTNLFTPEYKRRYAEYVRMRTGPEYQEALKVELGKQ